MGEKAVLNGFVIWMLVSGLIPLLLALNSHKLRKSKEVRYFSYLMISCALYSFFYVGELISEELSNKVLFLKLQYIGAVSLGPLLFLVILFYSGNARHVLSKYTKLLFIVPAVMLLTVFFNEYHYLFYAAYDSVVQGDLRVLVTEKGPLYWVHQVYTVLLLLLAQVYLGRMLLLGTVTDSSQVYFVWLGAIFPILAYIVHLLGIMSSQLDPIPFSFMGMGIFVFWGLVRFRLFKETPIVYKTLFESIADGVLVVDQDGKVVNYNPAFLQMIGGEVLLVPHILEAIEEGLHRASDSNKAVFPWDTQAEKHWYAASISIIGGAGSEALGKIIVVRDITSEIAYRKALEEAKEEAEQANRAKSEFLANMSHEIRTPLNGVIGFTELLGNTALSEQQKRYVTTAFTSANVLLDLINNVLDLSKIEAGKMELDIQEMNLRQVIRNIADVLSFQAAKDQIEFVLHIAPDVPHKFRGDEIKIKQVLINLLNNSFKFTHQGEVVLKISVAERRGGFVKLRCEVRDSGIGIPEEKQAMIFEAFSQADASTTKKYGGTGLGLTISNRLLNLMGSKLVLQSEEGRGSVFYFELPDIEIVEENPYLTKAYPDYSPALLVGFQGELEATLLFYLEQLKLEATSILGFADALEWLSSHTEAGIVFLHVERNQKGNFTYELRHFIGRLPSALQARCCMVFPADTAEETFTAAHSLGCRRKLIKPIMLMDMVSQFEKWQVERVTVDTLEVGGVALPTVIDRTVLVAEDNPVNRMLVKVYLTNLFPSLHVIEAENGKDAYDLYLKEKPDLLITDIHMPEMNGYELATKIRNGETTRRIPILALTANVLEGQEERCKKAGIDDYVSKPVRQDTFKRVMEKWLW
ncbi:histidine kinase N-terminal 7TM domain-containing protein [Lunatimonas salinarum]|uniref:histidine kinase N-terminal 7TM domain-containing protein n=1 Tax=Lunatimonas salinarum TaxID=1774590 RepID=UPI001ADF139F|nr:histidine kinase N-terminal 7TM domain-containing protein [Lunatimonas salinarum]